VDCIISRRKLTNQASRWKDEVYRILPESRKELSPGRLKKTWSIFRVLDRREKKKIGNLSAILRIPGGGMGGGACL